MTPLLETTRDRDDRPADAVSAAAAAAAAAASNRRRRRVFALTLLLACTASLYWVWSQPAQYRAEARWQFVFADRDDPAAAAAAAAVAQRAADADPAFLTEVQVITSRPLLEKLYAALTERGIAVAPPADTGADPVDALQRSLQVHTVPGTSIVRVQADGPWAEPLAPEINTLFDLYRQQLDASHRSDTGDAFAQARDEADALAARLDQKRREADAFRARHNIVSLERDENQLLAQVKGQSVSLNAANDKALAAESKLAALRQSIAAGKPFATPRDDAALANLEQRTSQAREELRSIERRFTEAYMALDPNVKALRARLANLEEQLKEARVSAQQSALSDAEAEVASTQATAAQLARQMNSARQSVQNFTARLAEYKSMQQDIDRIEAQRGAAVARATALELGSRRIAPTVREIEPASTPQGPWQPDYTRDAALAVGGSVLLALLVMALVELFNRPARLPPMLVERHWGVIEPASPQQHAPLEFDAFDNAAARPLPHQRARGAAPPPRLATAPAAAPVRELRDDEIGALIDAAPSPSTRALLIALLSGVSASEAAALNRGDVDPSARTLRLPDRRVPLCDALAESLAALRAEQPDAPLFTSADGARLGAADIDATVGFAAHDAALARADTIDAATLRDTCIAHLLRQGARFGELARRVGRLPPDAPGRFGRFAAAVPKRPIDEIDPVPPALRRLDDRERDEPRADAV